MVSCLEGLEDAGVVVDFFELTLTEELQEIFHRIFLEHGLNLGRLLVMLVRHRGTLREQLI